MGEDLELLGPGQGGVGVEVDLGQDAVQQEVWSCCLLPTWW
jgi:hypothetical protein